MSRDQKHWDFFYFFFFSPFRAVGIRGIRQHFSLLQSPCVQTAIGNPRGRGEREREREEKLNSNNCTNSNSNNRH